MPSLLPCLISNVMESPTDAHSVEYVQQWLWKLYHNYFMFICIAATMQLEINAVQFVHDSINH